MKKHTYRAKKVNDIDWAQLKERIVANETVSAIDIAKEKKFRLGRLFMPNIAMPQIGRRILILPTAS